MISFLKQHEMFYFALRNNKLKVGLTILLIFIAAGYRGGVVDEMLNMLTNIVLVIPTLAILLIIAAYLEVRGVLAESIFVGCTAWPWAARAIRAQTFSLRSRDFVDLARLSGMKARKIIFREIAPNMLSYLFMTFILRTLRFVSLANRALAVQVAWIAIDAHDMMCAVGGAVVSGGVRRAAMLSLFDDDDMRHCKHGDFERAYPQRANANTSSVWPKGGPSRIAFIRQFLEMVDSRSGEPGIFNRDAILNMRPARRAAGVVLAKRILQDAATA